MRVTGSMTIAGRYEADLADKGAEVKVL